MIKYIDLRGAKMETIKVEKKKTRMIAHRGLSGLETENTHAAFIAAANRSYYGMECDIHKTKDGVYIVIHDGNTNRVSSVNIEIKDATYEELLKVNLNHHQVPQAYLKIPTLQEYLDICYKYDKVGVIELKDYFTEADILEIIGIVEKKNCLNKVVFISFIAQNLIFVRKHYKELPLQLLTSEFKENIWYLCLNHKFDLDIVYSAINKDIVDMYHKNNLLINCWTVNDPKIAQELINIGVDFITTDILE